MRRTDGWVVGGSPATMRSSSECSLLTYLTTYVCAERVCDRSEATLGTTWENSSQQIADNKICIFKWPRYFFRAQKLLSIILILTIISYYCTHRYDFYRGLSTPCLFSFPSYILILFKKLRVTSANTETKWTRNTFCETWYLPHSWVHKSIAELCSNFGDSAITKGQFAYFSLRMRETALFLLPVKNLTSPSCSPTPISYDTREFWRYVNI